MSSWHHFPLDYRTHEIQAILSAVKSGQCVSLVGLSGSGKSNLMGFLAHRYTEIPVVRPIPKWPPLFCLLDCNQLADHSPDSLLRFIRNALESTGSSGNFPDEFVALESVLNDALRERLGICLLFDRFDRISVETGEPVKSAMFGNLRALRDRHKYALTYVIATRRPLDPQNELSELFFANTIWLGPLEENDAQWSIQEFAQRQGLEWDQATIQKIMRLSGTYPALLRAICEAFAAGSTLEISSLKDHPILTRRIKEFWADCPDDQVLQDLGLNQIELLALGSKPFSVDTTRLTAKENLLWQYFENHPGEVCSKDDLIQAVWPEDRVYAAGIRDDSLAQLVRRLREKIEEDPSNPRYIQTVPGRGYRFPSG